MGVNARPTESGMTLLEVVISLTIFLVTAGVVVVGFGSSLGLWQQTTAQVEADKLAGRACSRIAEILTCAGRDTIVENLQAPDGGDSITFRVSKGFANGEPVWGPVTVIRWVPSPEDPEDGIDNDGDGAIDEGVILLREDVGGPGERSTVLVGGVTPLFEGEVPNGADDNGNGLVDERGLSFERHGSVVNIRVTLKRKDGRGQWAERSAATSVAIRN